MMEIELSNGEKLKLPIPNDIPQGEAKLACGINKSGSTLFHKVMYDLCQADGTAFINVPNAAFEMGLTSDQWESDPKLQVTLNYCAILGGFRFLPEYLKTAPQLKDSVKGLLIRDPRDAMVSLYYSSIISHPIPEQGVLKEEMLKNREKGQTLKIDEFVLQQAKSLKLRFMSYLEDDQFMSSAKIWKYEDIIFKKEQWIDEICDFYRLNVNETTKQEIAQKHDIRPSVERKRKHIRKVSPEQYKDKFTKQTIEQLNNIFKAELSNFNYL